MRFGGSPVRLVFRAVCLVIVLFLGVSMAGQDQDANPPGKKVKKARNPVTAPVADVEGLPRVLLIGDSISMGYTLPVRALMKGKANVHRPAANCGPTTRGLENLDAWLATGGAAKKWDVIHFNWGLHDLKYMGDKGQNLANPKTPGSHQQVPPAAYEKNLRQLVGRLEKSGAKLVWCGTTPVVKGTQGRIAGDAARYNAIAAKVMEAHGIPTDDLYGFAMPHLAKIQKPSNVHFTAAGSKALAGQVAASIEMALPTDSGGE